MRTGRSETQDIVPFVIFVKLQFDVLAKSRDPLESAVESVSILVLSVVSHIFAVIVTVRVAISRGRRIL